MTHPTEPLIEQERTNAPIPASGDRRALLAGIGGLAATAFLAGKATAGPLTPPPGPIAPTPGPEPRIPVGPETTPGDTSSVFRITQPGSYYLTANVAGLSGRNGITIDASNVTLDLNGFALIGVPGSNIGVNSGSGAEVAVMNGAVRGFAVGVRLIGNSSARLQDVLTRDCVQAGIQAANCIITRCVARLNAGTGIFAEGSSVITDCIANFNTAAGFAVSGFSSLSNCVAQGNNARGFDVSGEAALNSCCAVGNLDGFAGIGAFTATNCVANQNTGSGFLFSSGSSGSIIGCTARLNNVHGISVSTGFLIRQNTLFRNGFQSVGAGIFVSGTRNRIEENHCTQADFGMRVLAAGNMVARNTCAGNGTNYEIVAGNVYGPVINVTVSFTPGVTGNSGADGSSTTHPWANFAQ